MDYGSGASHPFLRVHVQLRQIHIYTRTKRNVNASIHFNHSDEYALVEIETSVATQNEPVAIKWKIIMRRIYNALAGDDIHFRESNFFIIVIDKYVVKLPVGNIIN